MEANNQNNEMQVDQTALPPASSFFSDFTYFYYTTTTPSAEAEHDQDTSIASAANRAIPKRIAQFISSEATNLAKNICQRDNLEKEILSLQQSQRSAIFPSKYKVTITTHNKLVATEELEILVQKELMSKDITLKTAKYITLNTSIRDRRILLLSQIYKYLTADSYFNNASLYWHDAPWNPVITKFQSHLSDTLIKYAFDRDAQNLKDQLAKEKASKLAEQKEQKYRAEKAKLLNSESAANASNPAFVQEQLDKINRKINSGKGKDASKTSNASIQSRGRSQQRKNSRSRSNSRTLTPTNRRNSTARNQRSTSRSRRANSPHPNKERISNRNRNKKVSFAPKTALKRRN